MIHRPLVSVLIPTRAHESVAVAVDSLMAQTMQSMEIIVQVDDEHRGQGWARNRAAESARGYYVLFSDSDVLWEPDAVERLLAAYKKERETGAGFAYGGYTLMDGVRPIEVLCNEPWDWALLQRRNFVSTMSLMRLSDFRDYAFDEELHRLEDWDLWLRMGLAGYKGAWCGGVIFSTQKRLGITFGGEYLHADYEQRVRKKLGL